MIKSLFTAPRNRRSQLWAVRIEGFALISVCESKGAALTSLLKSFDHGLDAKIEKISRKAARAHFAALEISCPSFV